MTAPDVQFVQFFDGEPCKAPLDTLTAPAFDVPDGACDTHAHVFGPADRYPYDPERHYTPTGASPDDYRAMLRTLRIARGVLVQPSVYAADNRCLVDMLRTDPAHLRGVAVVDPAQVDDAALAALHDAGVRGARMNLVYRGGNSAEALETLAARIAPFGWHVQLLIDGRQIPELAPRIRRLPVPVVFDHFGQVQIAGGIASAEVRTLVELLTGGHAYVKLSGANRVFPDGPPFDAVLPLARHLADAAPQRCVWGSDWPHVAIRGDMLDTGRLFNLLEQWVPDAAARRAVLVDNPARLYGFDEDSA